LEETVNDSQLILECVVEDFDVKSVLLEKISEICPPDCIIATNTLRLDIPKLAENIKNKERFLGIRFLYPVYYISEVEVTPYKDTANWVIEQMRTLLSHMGKTLFFRSGPDPLILSEEKREIRKYQRMEEISKSSGFSPITQIREEGYFPDLSRNNYTELNRVFLHRTNQNQEFLSFDRDTVSGETKKSYLSTLFSRSKCEKKMEVTESLSCDNDCAICMDKKKNSVLRPCNHMVTCVSCSNILLNRQDNCPVCRIKIIEVNQFKLDKLVL